RRAATVALLTEELDTVPGVRLFANDAEGSPGFYKVGLRYDAEAFGLARGRLVSAMRAEGVALDEGFRALHAGRSPSRWRAVGPLAEADRAHAGALVLHHPVLLAGEGAVRQIGTALRRVHAHREGLR